MPTPTYVPIATTTLGSAASTVTFSSIPQTYTDLVLSITTYNTAANQQFRMNFNGSSSAHCYSVTAGQGGSRNSQVGDNNSYFYLWTTSTTPDWYVDKCIYTIFINDYSNSTKSSSWTGEGYAANPSVGQISVISNGLMVDYAAVTSITFSSSGGQYAANTTFNLWGING
jgi:hypothetical protein